MSDIKKLVKQLFEVAKENTNSKNFPKNLDKELFLSFVKYFYPTGSDYDYKTATVEELYNLALSAFNFYMEKKVGETKIRVFNPTIKNDGFESEFTIIDVINDDMPFLLDSTVVLLDLKGLKIERIIHPIYSVKYEKSKISSISKQSSAVDKNKTESVIQFHIEKVSSKSDLVEIEKSISKVLDAIKLVVNDWSEMINLTKSSLDEIDNAKSINNEVDEIKEFINWIIDGNFILLGVKEFKIVKAKDEYQLEEVKGKSFGVFNSKDEEIRPQVQNSSYQEVTESVKNPYIIEILKSRYRSKIHRLANAERIRVQKISKDGKVIGEIRLLGLFTSVAYNEATKHIPFIRHKVEKVIKNSQYVKGSHDYKDLVSVLESYPRDELLQINDKDLLKNAIGIVSITGRSQVRFFARNDKYNRFVSCLIYVPRNRHNSELRNKITQFLAENYKGEVADYYLQTNDSNLVRIYAIIKTNNKIPEVNEVFVEEEISKMIISWSDHFKDEIRKKLAGAKSQSLENNLFDKYKDSFSVSYQNRFSARRAVYDTLLTENCLKENKTIFSLYKSSENLGENITELKIYSPRNKIALSQIMPVLESYGFEVIKEHTYCVDISKASNNDVKEVWIHYFNLNLSNKNHKFSAEIKNVFEENIDLVWKNVLKVGLLNRLTIHSLLNWKEIYVLYAYVKYLYQIGLRYENSVIADILVKNGEITKLIVTMFDVKFNTSLKLKASERASEVEKLTSQIEEKLSNVSNITEDTVLRRIFGTIKATLRTNFYQKNSEGQFKGYISLKLDCAKVPNIPLPVMSAEIFVYSTKVEAIHLRGGKVARGGLRWSDRKDDFRTEVLGLVKAQMTKNAVIVPVGSKGGFVIKSDVSSLTREEIQKEAVECYKTFLRGLLDITDNIIGHKIKHPQDVLMYDKSDPYLVVAADKGTATFSDIANSVSKEYNFWLDDAFASGGSVGYDHKKMGITAKGAWVSVKRHFAEKGHNTQTQDFSCIGIGDMAGDVFGNGMLLSKHIKLVGAFNHLHIFLDPNPDSASSYKERLRMFHLPTSTWEDYNKSLISKGGGIFLRSAKTIRISPEVKKLLEIEEDELSPNKLIQAMLKAPVDLLWNGGIGTYVKSELESDLEVGDRANDALRINGKELRCKVVGEGGNLGFTQKGRIEYALNGGAINTDAMDNSAGVDCSDHEVNIKITLVAAINSGKLNIKQRNQILEEMTEEVSNLVLQDNKFQTQAISVAQFQSATILDEHSQFIERLEKSGLLNREIEFLPSKKEIEKRTIEKIGLLRPELCVLLAYSKMDIYNKILSSDLVKDKYFEQELFSYFPQIMQKKFKSEIESHQLRNEIIATQITNFVVNRFGISFVSQISRDTGFGPIDVIKNLIIACDSFGLRNLFEEIESLEEVCPEVQMKMFLNINKFVERSLIWLLRYNSKDSIEVTIKRFQKISKNLFKILPEVLAQASKEAFESKIEELLKNNVNKELSVKISALDPGSSVFDIAEISAESNFDIKTIAKIYFEVGTRFYLKWLRSKVSLLATDNHWQKLSNKAILNELYSYQLRISKEIINFNCSDKEKCKTNSVELWVNKMQFLVDRYDKFISDLQLSQVQDLSVFIVALNRLKPLLS